LNLYNGSQDEYVKLESASGGQITFNKNVVIASGKSLSVPSISLNGTNLQTTLSSLSNKCYSVQYTSSQTITIPSNVMKIDLMVFGSGGKAGASAQKTFTGNPVQYYSGGAGGGGQIITFIGVTLTAGTSLSLSVTSGTNGGTTTLTDTRNSNVIATAYNGNNGNNATASAAGTSVTTAITAPSYNANYGVSQKALYGSYGQSGALISQPNLPTQNGGFAGAWTSSASYAIGLGGYSTYTSGMIGAGQAYDNFVLLGATVWNGAYTPGGAIITYYLT
jgi:hypothetical protein